MTSEAFGIARQVLFGAVGGLLPFQIQIVRRGASDMALDVLAALYHGATAPLTLAFLTGIDTHVR